MGRDRDPFERTLQALRNQVTAHGPLQGAPLPVNAIAARLGVSPTPVREALSRLAGEGLVSHTPAGYAGVVHDAASLGGVYGLAGLLSLTLVRSHGGVATAQAGPVAMLLSLADRADNTALAEALSRALAQLTPFQAAEQACLSPERWPPAPGKTAEFVRRYFARRARRSAVILGAAIAAHLGPQL